MAFDGVASGTAGYFRNSAPFADVVKFHWDQPANRRAGDAQLIVADNVIMMSGTWSYHPKAYNSGLVGGGEWAFRRQPSDSSIARFYERLRCRLSMTTHRGASSALSKVMCLRCAARTRQCTSR
jgi:hypothetical protein